MNAACCKVLLPKIPQNLLFNGFYAVLNSSYTAYLGDRRASTSLNSPNKNQLGEEIKRSERGLNGYRIKVTQEIHMEEDPKFPCKNYEYTGDYHQCLEEEFVQESLRLINCTPPWMTDNSSLWCENEIALEKDDVYFNYTYFIKRIQFGLKASKQCLLPCKVTKYDVKTIGFMEYPSPGFYLVFDDVVEKTVSSPQVTFLALVSRFGGIIGLGKNLLWIIILLLSTLTLFKKRAA